MSVVGFDIGNENSYIAAVKSGGIEILDNEYNLRYTPTYVAFTENFRKIGFSAKANLITNLENTVFGFKRILGKKRGDGDTEDELAYLPHNICELSMGDIGIKVNYLKSTVVFSIEQLMAMVLTKLKLTAESKLGTKVRDCVVAVPVYYTDVQRRAMLNAASIANLTVLKLMNESIAVALSYSYFRQDVSEQECQNVIFVDVGNSSVTVTACEIFKNKLNILGCVWEDIGGRNFDHVLVQYFVDDIKNRYQLDAMTSQKALMSLMLECESLKKMMSANSLEITFQIECFMQDKDVQGRMKREIFESMSEHVFDKIEETLLRIFSETQLTPQDIHSVEIVGGSSRIPAVKGLIRKVFKQEPNSTLNQDEAVARGCALQCALLSPSLKTRNFIIEDKPSYVVKIAWKNVECNDEELEVVSRSDRLPSSKLITLRMSKPFTLAAFNVDSRSKRHKIGTFIFSDIPQDAEELGFIKLKVKSCLDIHGIFSLTSAKMAVKSTEIESEENISDPLDDQMDTSSSENDEITRSQEKVVKSSVEKFRDLTISFDVPSSAKNKLEEFVKAEQQMISNDAREKEKSDARNALEEFIYDAKGKISYELSDFVLEEDKSKFLKSLEDIQLWIYDNEDQEAVEYSRRLKEYQNLLNPIIKRYEEWNARPVIIDEYKRALQRSFEVLCNFQNLQNKENILPEEIDNLRGIWQNSKLYLDQAMEKFSNMKKFQDVPITVDELKKSLMKFRDEFQKSYSELEKRIDASRKQQQPLTGDGNSQDPHYSADNRPKLPEDSKKD